jgi:UPF0716 protein FxsA
MGGLLLVLFIVVPILEIGVFIQVGKWIGLWPTLAGIVMTALIGIALVRYQGFSVLRKAQDSVDEGRFPVAEVFDSLCLFIAGALLLIPGFLTDIVGFLLLVPPLRTWLRQSLAHRMLAAGQVEVWTDGPSPGRPSWPNTTREGIIIDADYEHVPEEPPPELPSERPREHGESPQRKANGRGGSPWRKGGPRRNGGDEGGKSDEREA